MKAKNINTRILSHCNLFYIYNLQLQNRVPQISFITIFNNIGHESKKYKYVNFELLQSLLYIQSSPSKLYASTPFKTDILIKILRLAGRIFNFS